MSLGNTAEFERVQLRSTFLERVLSFFFPPRLGRVAGHVEADDIDEQGWAGNVREKKYRDGIDRYFKENS